jgi:hypothetical protein
MQHMRRVRSHEEQTARGFGSFIPELLTVKDTHFKWAFLALTIPFDSVVSLIRALVAGETCIPNPIAPETQFDKTKSANLLDWLLRNPVCVLELRQVRAHPEKLHLWKDLKEKLVAAPDNAARYKFTSFSAEFTRDDLTTLTICMNDDALEHDDALRLLTIEPSPR